MDQQPCSGPGRGGRGWQTRSPGPAPSEDLRDPGLRGARPPAAPGGASPQAPAQSSRGAPRGQNDLSTCLAHAGGKRGSGDWNPALSDSHPSSRTASCLSGLVTLKCLLVFRVPAEGQSRLLHAQRLGRRRDIWVSPHLRRRLPGASARPAFACLLERLVIILRRFQRYRPVSFTWESHAIPWFSVVMLLRLRWVVSLPVGHLSEW